MKKFLASYEEKAGYSLVEYGDFFIPVADTEKILIDMVYYHEFLPEDFAILIILSSISCRDC